MKKTISGHSIYLTAGDHIVKLKVTIPDNPIGVTIMCDDQTQPELVSRNELVSQILNKECFITLQVVKEHKDYCDGNVVLPAILHWLEKESKYSYLPVTVFCSGRSANGILRAAAPLHKKISAIAVRSGLIELDPGELSLVQVPVLFVTADRDAEASENMKKLLTHLSTSHNFKVISNATRYFTELGKLGHVVFLAVEWFRKNMFANARSV